jgi:hypothetical protein
LEAIHFLPGTGRTTLIAASGAPINENRPKFDLGGVSETRAIQRVCLQDGLKLDLNWLIRQGAASPAYCRGYFRGLITAIRKPDLQPSDVGSCTATYDLHGL